MKKLFNHCLKRLLPLGLVASAAVALLVPAAANATPYVVTLVQQGSNVVATGSGAFDLTGLTLAGGGTSVASQVGANQGFIAIGPTLTTLDVYTGYSGPTSFGTGTNTAATTTSGEDFAGIFPVGYSAPYLLVRTGYASEDALFGTATYNNASFASLGVTPGTYVWTWGTGADQSFTLDIASVASVPEPASLGMFGLGVLLLGAFAERRRRMA